MNIQPAAMFGLVLIFLQLIGLDSNPQPNQLDSSNDEAKSRTGVRPSVRPNHKSGTPAMPFTNSPKLEADEAETSSERDEYNEVEKEIMLGTSINNTTDLNNDTYEASSNTSTNSNEPRVQPNSRDNETYLTNTKDTKSNNEIRKSLNDTNSNNVTKETTMPLKTPMLQVDPFHHITKTMHLHWGTFVSNIRDTAIKMWRYLSERMEETISNMPIIMEETKQDSNSDAAKNKELLK